MNDIRKTIGWGDYSWNPVTGCEGNCWYCYVKRFKDYDRTPTFHPERLNQPFGVKKSKKIFVCSTADLFATWVKDDWRWEVMNIVKQIPQHTFQFLTKHPLGYRGIYFPSNCHLGLTMDHFTPIELALFKQTELEENNLKFISFEPLMEPMPGEELLSGIDWVIIGALTGPGAADYKPKLHWIEQILKQADKYALPVFMKDNLKDSWAGELRQEFPKAGK